MKTIMVGFDEKMHRFFVQKDGVIELFEFVPEVLFGVTKFLKEVHDGQINTNRSPLVGKPTSDIIPKPEEPNR